MYSPPYNQVEDRAQLLEFMRANGFALDIPLINGVAAAILMSLAVFLIVEASKVLRSPRP